MAVCPPLCPVPHVVSEGCTRAGGQGNGFLMYTALVSCVRVATGAMNWKAMAAMHSTRCCSGFCTGAAQQRSYLWF